MKKGFTLIELTIVILIIGILASIAIIKFIDISINAKDSSDDSVIAALKTAINTKHLENIVTGNDSWNNYWPGGNPFDLLSQAPLYTEDVNKAISNPGQYWYCENLWGEWHLFCPHRSGPPLKGRMYIYYGSDLSEPTHPQGEFRLDTDNSYPH